MNQKQIPRLGRGGSPRSRKFSEETIEILGKLWLRMDRPGGKLMKAMLPK
jgi:hypothetical protein